MVERTDRTEPQLLDDLMQIAGEHGYRLSAFSLSKDGGISCVLEKVKDDG